MHFWVKIVCIIREILQ